MSTAPALRSRSPRVPFVRPIGLRPTDGTQEAQWLFAGNLSLGGCFVRTAKPPPIGSEVMVDLEANGKPLPFAIAEVVWSRTGSPGAGATALPGCGLRFRSLSAESRALVMHLVDMGGTGRGQSRTVPFGMSAAPKLSTREPLHAPVALIRDYLNTPPKPVARAAPFSADAVTDPHGTAIPPAPSSPPRAKIEVDLGALAEPSQVIPFPLSGGPSTLGVGALPPSRDPWFDAAHLNAERPSEPSFEPRSVGRVATHDLEAPPRRGASLMASLLAGMAVGGAILGAIVMAEKGLRLAHSPSLAMLESSVPADDILAQALTPSEPSAPTPPSTPPRTAAPHPVAAIVTSPPSQAAPATAPHVTAAPPTPAASDEAEIALPTGAATGVKISGSETTLKVEPDLTPGSSIDRVFTLASPPRLVIDLNGATPKGTPHVDGRGGVTSVRLGVRPGGTRLVLDLAHGGTRVHTQGNVITVD